MTAALLLPARQCSSACTWHPSFGLTGLSLFKVEYDGETRDCVCVRDRLVFRWKGVENCCIPSAIGNWWKPRAEIVLICAKSPAVLEIDIVWSRGFVME